MRKVYTPPSSKAGRVIPLIGAALLSLLVFLVLPLTQMVSSGLNKQLTLTKVDAAALEAPVDDIEPPPPPPEPEPEEEPPPPQLSDAPQPMNLSVDLDVAMGSGGAFGSGSGLFDGNNVANDLMDAFDVAELERRPEVVSSVSPVYPAELRKAKVEGVVSIVFVLDEEGRVEDPRVENASRPEFEKPALDAVRKWKFKPGLKDGNPVRTYMRLPMRFRVAS